MKTDNITHIYFKVIIQIPSLYTQAFIVYPNNNSTKSSHLPMVAANSPMSRWNILLCYFHLSHTLKLWKPILVKIQIVYNHHTVLVHRLPQYTLANFLRFALACLGEWIKRTYSGIWNTQIQHSFIPHYSFWYYHFSRWLEKHSLALQTPRHIWLHDYTS